MGLTRRSVSQEDGMNDRPEEGIAIASEEVEAVEGVDSSVGEGCFEGLLGKRADCVLDTRVGRH